MGTTPPTAWQYSFRTPDATVYGPVDLATLCLWATDARVIPGCELSVDRTTWFPVESLAELRLNWTVHLEDKTTYGPLNLLAIWTLAAEKSIPRGLRLVEQATGRTAVLDDSLHALLVDECRRLLNGSGSALNGAITALQARMDMLTAELAARDGLIAGLRLKLEQAEAELAANMKLVSETQLRMAEALESGRDASRKYSESLAQSRSEVETLAGSLQAVRLQLQASEARVVELESSCEAFKAGAEALSVKAQASETRIQELESRQAAVRAENEGLAAQLRGKDAAWEKERMMARQREEAGTRQVAEVRDALAKAQKAGRQAEQELKDEMASVQRDLNALMRASHCIKQAVPDGKSRPAPIDWIGDGRESGAFPRDGDDAEARFDRLPLSEKFVVLQKELQASAEEKESLRSETETLRRRCEHVQAESSRKEKASSEKLAQIQKEIKTSSELLARTMEELERRERLLRESRRTGTASPGDAAPAPIVLDAEVVHSEVLGPDEVGQLEAVKEPVLEPVSAGSGPAGGNGVLNNVEAQLQRELKRWEAAKREKSKRGGTLGKWFRRGTS